MEMQEELVHYSTLMNARNSVQTQKEHVHTLQSITVQVFNKDHGVKKVFKLLKSNFMHVYVCTLKGLCSR